MGFIKRALSLPARRSTYVEKELVTHHHPKMSWKLAKKEADKSRKILGPGASPEEVLRETSERLGTSAPAPKPVTEERELETEKEVNTPTLEPVKEAREVEEEEKEEEFLPGLICSDIRVTDSELETICRAPKPLEEPVEPLEEPVEPLEEPVEEQLELKTEEEEEMKTSTLEPVEKEPESEIEDEETGIPGLTWGDINRINANAKTTLAALTCW